MEEDLEALSKDQQIIDKIISILSDNIDKLEHTNTESIDCLSLIVFKQVNEDTIEEFVYAYEFFLEKTDFKVIFQVMEKVFNGRDFTGKQWLVTGTPFELIVFTDNPNFEKAKTVFDTVVAREKAIAEEKHTTLVDHLLNDKLTLENPINKIIKMTEKSVANTGSMTQDVTILDFSRKDETDDSGSDEDTD